MNDYTQHNAERFYGKTEHEEPRSSNGADRNAYQMHEQRFTAEQKENAARLARGLSFAYLVDIW